MSRLEDLEIGKRTLYSSGYFSGDYNQDLYLKRSVDDGSNKPKFYISVFSMIDGRLSQQGYLYFYLDFEKKTSDFIGIMVEENYRNLNISSFLVANWIDLCLNNGFDFLGTNENQRKPFLLYLLKTYGFEILDKSLYVDRPDVISICKSRDKNDKRKFLLFRDAKHENTFVNMNVYKNDNYEIVHDRNDLIHLDDVIIPLQGRKRNEVKYELLDYAQAINKADTVIARHRR